MSNLGSYGSSNFQQQTTKYVEEESPKIDSFVNKEEQMKQTLNQISNLIQSKNISNHITAIKMLLALLSKGYDVEEFCPSVLQLMANSDLACRQYVCIFLNYYINEQPDTAMLCVNMFQKYLTDSDPIIRLMSLKLMSSITVKEVSPMLFDVVSRCVGDVFPYVRKEAAYSIIKIVENDPDEFDNYVPLIERLLNDRDPIAFSGSIALYWSLCNESVELLHPHFRFMCTQIERFDSYTQVLIIRSLLIYSRLCFHNPLTISDEDDDEFWDETTQQKTISSDQLLAIQACKKVLNSLNSAVIITAASYLYYCSTSKDIVSIIKPLIRLIYEDEITSEIALSTIATISSKYNYIFIPYLNHFLIHKNDSYGIKNNKIKILTTTTKQTNIDIILKELIFIVNDKDIKLSLNAINSIGKIALNNNDEDIIQKCLNSLINLIDIKKDEILYQITEIISYIIINKNEIINGTKSFENICKKYSISNDSNLHIAILLIANELYNLYPNIIMQLVNFITRNLDNEVNEVKLQLLLLSTKLIITNSINSKTPLYILHKCLNDHDFDIRDRSEFYLKLINIQNENIKEKLNLLFNNKTQNNFDDINEVSKYQIGTFSNFFNKEINGYEEVPKWCNENEIPNENVRNEFKDEKIEQKFDEEEYEEFFEEENVFEEEEENFFD